MNLPIEFTHGGWIDDKEKVDEVKSQMAHPFFVSAAPSLMETGKGKTIVLTDHVRTVLGYFPEMKQGTGDCVSFGAAYTTMATACVDIAVKKEFETLNKLISTEDIYGGSRMVIGKGRLGSGQGSIGAWAAKWMIEYGTLLRQKYNDKIDLTTYSAQRANSWGVNLPKEVIGLGKTNRITNYSAVTSYNECIDSIANGYAVIVCSNQGFNNTRDAQGFLKPSGSWAHAMSILGFDDAGPRKSVLIQNSWGTNWVSGPKRLNQPDGSFWVDANVVDRMLKQGDSWSIAGFEGYKPKEIDISIAW